MPDLPFLSSPLHTHLEVIERAREIGKDGGLSKVVVAAAEEDDILRAMYACKQEGIADSILTGYPDRVNEALEKAEVPRDTFELVPTADENESAVKTAELAGQGEADIVMKGFIKTSTLLKTLLKHDYGLRDRELVSHSAVLYIPEYGRLLNMTDGGTLVKPTFEQKLTIILNAVQVMRAVGVEKPKVAVLAPARTVREDIPETVEAEDLVKLVRRYWSGYLEIDGPLPFDLVVESADELGIDSKSTISGQVDILLGHTIEEVNITAKTLIQFGGAIFMGVISGAHVPISLVSRSDTIMNKKSSVALAVCLADFQRRGFARIPAIDLHGEGI